MVCNSVEVFLEFGPMAGSPCFYQASCLGFEAHPGIILLSPPL